MFNKVINAVKRCYNKVVFFFTTKSLVLGSSLMVVAGSSQAAVDASVTTAITDAATDVATIGALVLTVIVAIYGFKWLRRAF